MVAVERIIDAPVDGVWSVFVDLSARPRWLSTVEAVEVLVPGAFQTGTAWRETRLVTARATIVEELRVVGCVPGNSITLASPGIGAEYRMTYTFLPRDGRTRVRIVLTGTPQGPASRVLALLLGGLAARTVEGALRRDLDDLAAAATKR
jgi:uncharacterized membrane protein